MLQIPNTLQTQDRELPRQAVLLSTHLHKISGCHLDHFHLVEFEYI